MFCMLGPSPVEAGELRAPRGRRASEGAGHGMEWGVQDLVSSLVSLLGDGGSGARHDSCHPRMLETILWILSSLAPVLVGAAPGHPSPSLSSPSPHTPPPPLHSQPLSPECPSTPPAPSATALVHALELTYLALDSPRTATARGAAVAWMKISGVPKEPWIKHTRALP